MTCNVGANTSLFDWSPESESKLMAVATPGPVPPQASLKRLGRDTLIYGVSSVLSRIVSFIMLPVYTRVLTPGDYGVLSLLDNTIDVATILFTAGALAGTQRYYFRTESEEDRLQVVGTAFYRLIFFSMLGTLALALGAPVIWRYFLHGAGSPGLLRIAAATFFLGDLAPVPLLLLQIRQRAGLLSAIGITRLLVQLSLNILLVVHFHWGVAGVLTSTMITTGLVGITGVVILLRIVGRRYDPKIAKDLRRFGRPYQASAAASFILTFGDRFFLQALAGSAVVGLYGLAYQFGFLLTQLGVVPFMRAWSPIRFFQASRPREERDPHYDRAFFWFNLVLFALAVGIAVLVRPVLRIVTGPAFHPAAALVPIILGAYILQSWSEAAKFQVDMSEKTKYFAMAQWLSVVLILVLYATLIPRWGAAGAAWATLLAFAGRQAILHFWTQRLWPITLRWWRLARLWLVSIAVTVPATYLPVSGIAAQMALGGVLYLVWLALVWVVVLEPPEKELLQRVVHSPGSALREFASS